MRDLVHWNRLQERDYAECCSTKDAPKVLHNPQRTATHAILLALLANARFPFHSALLSGSHGSVRPN